MIKSKKQKLGIEIDLTGPDGNAFVLIGTAGNLAKQLGLDKAKIQAEMMAGDYENLIKVFDKNFGNFIKSIFEHNFLYFPQTFFVNNNKTEKRSISFIGRYENYSNDVNLLFKKLGHPTPKIPHLNKNSIYERHPNLNQHKYYKSLYREDWIKDWVITKYKNDFQTFNYELDI